jgi:acyl dehydratase
MRQNREETPVPHVLETPFSLRDLVGRELTLTDWFPIAQERIEQFAEVTEDRQWIHVDRERAERESPYGTTIAHGFLNLVAAEPVYEGGNSDPRRCPHERQLRLESSSISFCCPRRL